MYPAMRGGVVDTVTGRINDKPRFKVWNSTGYFPGTVGQIAWTDIARDTDRMCEDAIATGLVKCITPGVYAVKAQLQFDVGANPFFSRIIQNYLLPSQVTIADSAMSAAGGAYQTHQILFGFWEAEIGDTLALHVTNAAPTNMDGGEAILYMQGVHISSFGSDNQ